MNSTANIQSPTSPQAENEDDDSSAPTPTPPQPSPVFPAAVVLSPSRLPPVEPAAPAEKASVFGAGSSWMDAIKEGKTPPQVTPTFTFPSMTSSPFSFGSPSPAPVSAPAPSPTPPVMSSPASEVSSSPQPASIFGTGLKTPAFSFGSFASTQPSTSAFSSPAPPPPKPSPISEVAPFVLSAPLIPFEAPAAVSPNNVFGQGKSWMDQARDNSLQTTPTQTRFSFPAFTPPHAHITAQPPISTQSPSSSSSPSGSVFGSSSSSKPHSFGTFSSSGGSPFAFGIVSPATVPAAFGGQPSKQTSTTHTPNPPIDTPSEHIEEQITQGDKQKDAEDREGFDEGDQEEQDGDVADDTPLEEDVDGENDGEEDTPPDPTSETDE
eukprot:TRINITY_DN1360_c1_g1_i1.p1 TRINITY_DN1360_c1_g1~~TRINITY_DN1360_c1_g1_i1.p1  ORF type:complete len:379 (+),score=112.49 TRINITY_DN1360_c1_g1_i1:734-1870(+)